MSIRSIGAIAVLWMLSLFAVGTAVKAQVYGVTPLAEPKVLSGGDIGFRMEGHQDGRPVGTLVVRINSRWVEAEVVPKPAVRPARSSALP